MVIYTVKIDLTGHRCRPASNYLPGLLLAAGIAAVSRVKVGRSLESYAVYREDGLNLALSKSLVARGLSALTLDEY